jgi:hypothetical protein
LLLELELLGAMVPVGDLLGEAILDRRARLLDPRQTPLAHLANMFGHDLRNGVALGALLQIFRDPR